jgi:hypothetical protein
MKMSADERAAARAETLADGRAMFERIEEMLLASAPKDATDEQHLDAQDAGRLEGLRHRRDELKAALKLSPARGAAAVARVRRECQRTVNWVEREAAADREPGTAYDWGVWQADFDIIGS